MAVRRPQRSEAADAAAGRSGHAGAPGLAAGRFLEMHYSCKIPIPVPRAGARPSARERGIGQDTVRHGLRQIEEETE